MASLFFACEVHRALRTVVSADNIVTQGAVTIQDAAADFLRTTLSDHTEFRHIPDVETLLTVVEGRTKVPHRCIHRATD